MPPDRNPASPDHSEALFYQHLTQLTEQALRARPDKARKAQRDLIREVNSNPFFDPVFVVFDLAQKELFQNRSPRTVRRTLDFMGDFSMAVQNDVSQKNGKILHLNTIVLRSASNVIQRDPQIQQDSLLRSALPVSYINMIKRARNAVSQADRGIAWTNLIYGDPLSGISEESVQHFNDWFEQIKHYLTSELIEEGMSLHERRDSFVDSLKDEPDVLLGGTRLFDRNYSGISLRDLESSTLVDEESLDKLTAYLVEALSSKDTNFYYKHLLGFLFFDSAIFFNAETNEQIPYRNQKLITNIALWQKHFMEKLMLNEGIEKDERVGAILREITETNSVYLLALLARWSSYPAEFDPFYTGDNREERQPQYKLQNAALKQFIESNPDQSIILLDEIGYSFSRNYLLPKLEELLLNFGAVRNFSIAISKSKEAGGMFDYSEYHLEVLRDIFAENCGEDFLDKLNLHASEIQNILNSVWQSLRLHFLPIENGINIIDFSGESVPNMLGLKDITLQRRGSPQDWEIDVRFSFNGTSIVTVGKLDQKGELRLPSPLDKYTPGLYLMLNLIAVAVFRDLTTQEEGTNRNRSGENATGKEVNVHRTQTQMLPRKQTDIHLTRDVYKYTGFTPRRVELHRMWLPGHDEYSAAINLFNEALESGASELTLQWITEELEEARKKAHKTSPEKIRTRPAKFELDHVKDPLDDQIRYLRTWVVEHSSPKPTDEELKSPFKLYERYYSKSSALSFLDQIKPWFVGS